MRIGKIRTGFGEDIFIGRGNFALKFQASFVLDIFQIVSILIQKYLGKGSLLKRT